MRFLVLVSLLLCGCQPAPDALRIEVVSSPAEWVSGGDARVEIHLPEGISIEEIEVSVDDRILTERFSFAPETRTLSGLLDGLPPGDSRVSVEAGLASAALTLTNHDARGPLFSGPAQEPFLCATEEHRANAALGAPIDADCTLETVVSFVYKSTDTGAFEPYDPASPRPADLAQTTTMDGQTFDFIVRWERGTLNRFIYSLAMLSPGVLATDAPDLSAWNRRLIYYFQGGVGIGHYQGNPNRQRMLYEYGADESPNACRHHQYRAPGCPPQPRVPPVPGFTADRRLAENPGSRQPA
jgi:hypothetical protein